MFTPTLVPQHWSWPDPNSPSFGQAVPQIVGMAAKDAQAQLTAAGFKMAYLDPSLQCASPQPPGTIAFAGPQLATPGSTITVCVSNSIQQYIYRAPAPVIKSRSPNPPPAQTSAGTRPGGGGGRTITFPGGTITVPAPPAPPH
jgi:beta-lactam-binding protein with PASTA domain